MSSLRAAFEDVLARRSLDAVTAERAFGEILDAVAPEALIAGFLVALKLKGESASELKGAARAMRARARAVNLGEKHLLDVVGTGGDGSGSFNISTGAALIAATAGIPVAKHGNRAISGRVGAADVLEQMGVKIDIDPERLARCLVAAGICFIFAPAYHPVLARLAPLRRALGTRTIFNLLGPLCNPAVPRRAVVGVGDAAVFKPMAEALGSLGVEHAMVVCGGDGMDEISLSASTRVAELRGEAPIAEYEIAPEDFGIKRAARETLAANDLRHAAAILGAVLAGEPGAAQDVLALNAGAAMYVGGKAKSLRAGVARAREIAASGGALATLEKLAAASQGQIP
ncbi:MAG TPA: anthranilate phosphoribosyltransferase [Candidatus Binataceae bacterium]|nr:anthranilate phosphoribosyltransferase [Candidatus Binataceae bacterium]